MKIAVVGIGVAGAYLMNRLSDDHNIHVVGFERMQETVALISMTMSCITASTCRWTWRRREA
jgi:6-phosphogluconate dehydrogenase (decarboxylating)